MTIPTQEQWRMASFLNLHPDMPETWPMDLIDKLVDLEKHKGIQEVYRELSRMLQR